jgi:hypothetical protein
VAVRRFLLTLVSAVAAVAAVGALLAVMTGGAAGHTIAVTLAVVGGILTGVNVVVGGSGGPIADARTGFGFGRNGVAGQYAELLEASGVDTAVGRRTRTGATWPARQQPWSSRN